MVKSNLFVSATMRRCNQRRIILPMFGQERHSEIHTEGGGAAEIAGFKGMTNNTAYSTGQAARGEHFHPPFDTGKKLEVCV